MHKYRHIFFDLDRTIWDFEANSKDTFFELFDEYGLSENYTDFDSFFSIYTRHNNELWALYREGLIKKKALSVKRFALTLNDGGIDDEAFAEKLGEEYVTKSPCKTKLFDGAHEILEYLNQYYTLHVITNGFMEVQYKKLEKADLRKYFDKIFISEEVGAKKPQPEIFRYAITSVNAKKGESLMIGDDLNVDIIGAKSFGIDQVYFNPDRINHDEKISYEITKLIELRDIL